MNAFGLEEDADLSGVYDNITRMSHSCIANCFRSFDGRRLLIHAARAVPAGEELTIPYVPQRDLEPTHKRRHQYLMYKDFTCHCPRCDAEGDDTRQFNCFDPSCKGAHFVCQPLNKLPLLYPSQHYTGVEYVEPQLLPCTVCQRSPPSEYQTAMFELEARLPELINKWLSYSKSHYGPQATTDQWRKVADAAAATHYPPRHFASLQLRLELLNVICYIHARSPDPRPVVEAAMDLVSVYDAALGENNAFSMMLCMHMADMLETHRHFVAVCRAAIVLQRKALRLHCLLQGREHRTPAYDNLLVSLLKALPDSERHVHPYGIKQCAFCEEATGAICMTLSVCGRCRKVAYCSKGCQKAHWALHKSVCKA